MLEGEGKTLEMDINLIEGEIGEDLEVEEDRRLLEGEEGLEGRIVGILQVKIRLDPVDLQVRNLVNLNLSLHLDFN